jgi:SEC-C motif
MSMKMKVGRNDPCPCGSGRKFKKCCDAPKPVTASELLWRQMRSARDGLIPQIWKFTDRTYGDVAIFEAWDEFHLWEGVEFDPQSPEMMAFMPYFLYDWTPDPEDSETKESAPRDLSPAAAFLKENESKLDPMERSYIEACLSEPLTFFEVAENFAGEGFVLRDIFTERELRVTEKSGSERAHCGDILFAKAATVNSVTILESCAPLLIPPIWKEPLLTLRKRIRKLHDPITPAVLQEYVFEMLELYDEFRERAENPQLPQLCNTDGDPLEFHKLFFEIESAEETFKSLHILNVIDSEEEQRQDAVLNESGTIESIEITWNKMGNKKMKEWDNTILGNLQLDGSSLIASVNSAKRAQKIRGLIEKKLGSKVTYKRTVIEPMDQKLSEMKTSGPARERNEETERLNALPEVREHIAKMMEAHWDGWIHEKIPALGGKTPLQAAKDKDGREMLEALLTQFARQNERGSNMPPPPIAKLRERLGLPLE